MMIKAIFILGLVCFAGCGSCEADNIFACKRACGDRMISYSVTDGCRCAGKLNRNGKRQR